jgi:hypothetical protein
VDEKDQPRPLSSVNSAAPNVRICVNLTGKAVPCSPQERSTLNTQLSTLNERKKKYAAADERIFWR